MKLDQIDVSTVSYSYTSWSNFSMIDWTLVAFNVDLRVSGSRLLWSATTWSSVCISASFFVIDWLTVTSGQLNVQLHQWSQSVNKQLTEPAETQLMYSMCVDMMTRWSQCQHQENGGQLTRSLNSAVDRSRDLSAFRPLTFHCTSGSYVWRIR